MPDEPAWDWQVLGIGGEEAFALYLLGLLALMRGAPEEARARFDAGLATARTAAHRVGEGMNLWGLAMLIGRDKGAFSAARAAAQASIDCFTDAGWQRGLAGVLGFLGDLSYRQGAYVEAQSLLHQDLAIAVELGAAWWSSPALVCLGLIAIETGDLAVASARLAHGTQLSLQLGDQEGVASGLAGFALLAAARGDADRVWRLASAATRLFSRAYALPPGSDARRDRWRNPRWARASPREALERLVATRPGRPGDAAAWAAGLAMPWEAAVDEALSTWEPVRHSAASSGRSAGGLSEREGQVLRLVATGMTNREIAAELALSDKTIKRHLGNIFNKLGVSSRAGATAFAVRSGIA